MPVDCLTAPPLGVVALPVAGCRVDYLAVAAVVVGQSAGAWSMSVAVVGCRAGGVAIALPDKAAVSVFRLPVRSVVCCLSTGPVTSSLFPPSVAVQCCLPGSVAVVGGVSPTGAVRRVTVETISSHTVVTMGLTMVICMLVVGSPLLVISVASTTEQGGGAATARTGARAMVLRSCSATCTTVTAAVAARQPESETPFSAVEGAQSTGDQARPLGTPQTGAVRRCAGVRRVGAPLHPHPYRCRSRWPLSPVSATQTPGIVRSRTIWGYGQMPGAGSGTGTGTVRATDGTSALQPAVEAATPARQRHGPTVATRCGNRPATNRRGRAATRHTVGGNRTGEGLPC